MAIVFALIASLLTACGLGLAGLGVGMSIEGSVGVGLAFALPVGLFVSYGGYLFARTAVRTRRELKTNPPTAAVRRFRRSMIRFVVGSTAFLAILYISLPLPIGVRVISVIASVLVAGLFLATQFEPPKERHDTPPPG